MRAGRHFALWSLAALGLGLGLGILLHGVSSPTLESIASVLRTVGRIWLLALQYAVIPLVVTQALFAVLATEQLGALGARTLLLFVAMLVAASVFTLLVGRPLVSLYHPDPRTVAALQAGVAVPEALRASLEHQASAGDWLRGILRGSNLLLVLVGTIAVGVIGRMLPGTARERFRAAVQRLATLVMGLVGWILVLTPLGVLALSFGFARGAGVGAAGFLGVFVVMVCAMLLLVTALLYPATLLLGRIPLARFARAAAPAQLVALGTRSSLATLPAMVETARTGLGLPPAGTGFVLPLAVATFKLNIGVSHPFMLLFLANAFGVTLSFGTIVVFMATVLLFSFATPGIPGGAPGVGSLPAFVAAGIPLEGMLIVDAVDPIPDIFKTLLNVTGDLSAAAILTGRPAA